MRKIGFRAWDGKQMCYPVVFEFGVSGVSGETSMAFAVGSGGMVTTAYIMQSTGMEDRCGTDIYEGDFLTDDYDRILLVEWYKYGFCFKAITETNFVRACDIMEWFEGDTSKPLIIGNVYENKELLDVV